MLTHEEDMNLFESFYNQDILPSIKDLPQYTINLIYDACKFTWLKRQHIHLQHIRAHQQVDSVMRIAYKE